MQSSILEKIAAGESSAVQECLDRYGNLVWSLARRHAADRPEAEDAVQEIFIELWKKAARFDRQKASEEAFICMVARRRLIDRHRRRQHRPLTESLVTPEGETRDMPDATADRAESCAEAALAARAMAQLDPKERKVILLSTYHGMSHGQIAEHTGIPLGTVKTCIRRGLARVKELLEGASRSRLQEAG